MSDKTTTLKISADASGVEAGVSTAKRSLASLGAAAKGVGESAGKGMAPIGEGAEGAAKKIDNATKSIIGSIQRTTALMEAGERGSAKYYEALGAQRGVSVDALRPYIAQLEAVKEKQAQASAALAGGSVSLGKVEMSARATSAALRGVPAQFTDIITSLQGGQAPMTVLLQQGGQLKDMFGGAGNAAKALGGYVVGLINPFTIAAAAVGTLAVAYHQGAEEARAFQNAATLTGGAIGVSNTQFALMAQSISSIAGTRGKASEVLTEIASTGKLAGAEIKGIAEAAILMEKATGQAVSKTVAEFVKLSEEPAKASIELNKQYNYLTASVYEQIKALEDQGKKTQAAELAEKSYADALKSRALSVVENAGLMEKAWRGITGSAKGAWDAMLDVGRASSSGDQVATLEKQLRDRQERNAGLGIKGGAATQQIIDQIAALKETVRLEQRSTEAIAERARIQAAGTAAIDAVAKANERAASKQEQLNKALREYRDGIAAIRAANPESALLDPKKIAAAEAGIRDQFKGTKAPAAKPDAFMTDVARVYTKALDDLDKVQLNASASADKLSKTQEILRGIQASPEWAAFSMRKQEEVIMSASLAQAEEDRVATLAAAKKAQDAYNSAARDSADSIAKKLESLGDETRAYAIAIEKNISLAEAIDLVAIARLEEEVVRAKIANNDTGAKELEREIELRKELAKELRKKADNTAMVEAGKEAAKATSAEWKRGWEETDRLARDVFTTWAVDGSNAAQKIGDTLKKALLSAIYDATIKPIVLQIYSSVMGNGGGTAGSVLSAVGGGGSAGGMGGVSGLSSLYSAGKNLFTTAGNYFTTATNSLAGVYANMTGVPLSSVIGTTAASTVGATAGGTAIGGSAGIGSGTVLGGGAATGASTGMAGFAGIPVVGWIMMGMMASAEAYDQGLRADNKDIQARDPSLIASTWVDKLLGGIGFDDKTSAIISGSAFHAAVSNFVLGGNTISDAGGGITGQLSTTGASAQRRTDYKQDHRGFLGIGSYTTHNSSFSELDGGAQATLDGGVRATTAAVKAYAAAIGLTADAVNGFTQDINIDLGGLDAEGVQKKLIETFAGFGDAMITSAYGSALEGLARAGEKPSATLERLSSSLGIVNADLKQLGINLLPVSVASAGIASGLVDAFGGVEKMQSSVGAYYDAFYSDAEKAANVTANLGAQFAALGVSVPASKEEFRSLVESIDVSTVSGQNLVASLINLAPAFDQASASARAAANNMLSAIQNWGSASDVRGFQAQQLQQTLAAGGLSLSIGEIMGATQASALAYYQSLDPSSSQAQVLLANQQAIYDFVGGGRQAAGGFGSGVGSSGGGGGGGSAGETAASSIANAWQQITDSIFAEVKRIRGLIEGTGEAAFAAAQTRFSIATAQARAGDQEAAQALPELSQNLLTLGENNAQTLLQLRILQGQTAASLTTTGGILSARFGLTVPSVGVGASPVPQPIAQAYTPVYNPVQSGGVARNDAATAAALAALAERLELIEANTRAGAQHAGSVARQLTRAMPDGDAIQTREVPA